MGQAQGQGKNEENIMRICQLLSVILGSRRGGASTYSITGSVEDGESVGVEDVLVTLSGDADDTTTTNASGEYEFTDVSPGEYTITPTKDYYSIDPESREAEVVNDAVEVEPFAATALPSPVSLPWQLTFDTDDPITEGAVPTWDDTKWRQDGTSIYSVAATPTIDGYNPNSLFDKVLRINPNDTYTQVYFQYSLLKDIERFIDPSDGFRICILSGTESSDEQHRVLGSISDMAGDDLTGGSADGVSWGISTLNNPDQVNLEYKNDSGSWVDLLNWANLTTSSTQHSCWMATKVQIPASFSGTAQIWMKILGDHAVEDSKTATMAGSWADVVFEQIYFSMANRGTASQYLDFGMFWIGSLTDDWPV